MSNLFEAIATEDLDLVRQLLQTGRLQELASDEMYLSLGETPLHQAVATGNVDLVRLMLDSGAKDLFLNSFDDLSCTPLMIAARERLSLIIELLIQYGADVNSHDEARIGDTALAAVVDSGFLDIVQLLLKHGADPDIPGWMQLTARNRAQRNGEKSLPGATAYLIWQEIQKRRI